MSRDESGASEAEKASAQADTRLARAALDLFEQALDQPDETRQAWIESACGADVALLAEVNRMLRADTSLSGLALESLNVLMPQPERIGAYRIVSVLGEGGMGVTYAGERDDGMFEHSVAIKVVRPSAIPETARALFEKERRALAKLSHRHIAQLFDGGVGEGGAPYFIMERVVGQTIDAWAIGKSANEIAAVLIDVCGAVQFAHQNLVVHADIKPANILVNAQGDAKIVDFGVARLLHDEDAGSVFPYTPGFASPSRMAGAPPTPADDVFALGALARALLAGKSMEARADLEAIVARATADDSGARYASADALGSDLRSWLQFYPIEEKRGDSWNVLRKFVRRRRLRVVVAGLALAGLLGGLGLTSFLYAQAERSRQLAEARFVDVRELAHYLLFDVYDRLEQTPHSLTMRRDAARVAHNYLEQLAQSPRAPADVRRETVESLIRISDIQAGRQHANLGDYAGAKSNLAAAEALAQTLQGGEVIQLRIEIALRRANIAMNIDQDMQYAAAQIEAARGLLTQLKPERRVLLELDVEAATLANWQSQYDVAVRIAREALARVPDTQSLSREEVFLKALAFDALAEAEYYQENLAAAEADYRRYVEITSTYANAHPEDIEGLRNSIRARWALVTTLLQENRPREALVEISPAAPKAAALVAFEPDDEASLRLQRTVLAALAQSLAMSGRFTEGVRLLESQVAEREALYRAAPDEATRVRTYAISLAMLADVLADNNRTTRACAIYTDAEGLLRGLDQRGQLSPQDRGSALQMILDREARHCRH